MKTLILLLLLVSCNNILKPDFKVGDCIVDSSERESWEDKPNIFHIVEIGKENYRALYMTPRYMLGFQTTMYINITDRYYKKVECPK